MCGPLNSLAESGRCQLQLVLDSPIPDLLGLRLADVKRLSDDDDDRTLVAASPPDANDPHISAPAVPAKLVTTITASPADTGSDGLPVGCLKERDGGGPSSKMEDQHLEPTGSAPTAPNPPSRKRTGPPTGSYAQSKWSCGSSRMAARRRTEHAMDTRWVPRWSIQRWSEIACNVWSEMAACNVGRRWQPHSCIQSELSLALFFFL